MTRSNCIAAANGRWREILVNVAGVDPAVLNGKPSACPICREGTDRFTFDDREGRGTWLCRQCPSAAGKSADAGDGMALLQAVTGWDFKRAADELERYLSLPPEVAGNGRRPGPARVRSQPPAPALAAPQAPIRLLRLSRPAAWVGLNPDGEHTTLRIGRADVRTTIEAVYRYSTRQQVTRHRPDGDDRKQFLPQHRAAGDWRNGAGPDLWPAWRQGEVIKLAQQSPGCWVLEAEGEKAAEIARQGGLACISQPGHAHKSEQIQPRYEALKAAGVAGVVYLADEDREGHRRALQALDAAAAVVGLPLVILPAAEVWSQLPQGGSIDDAPNLPAERAAAIQREIGRIEPHQWAEVLADWEERLGVAQKAGCQAGDPRPLAQEAVRDRLRVAIADGVGGSDLEVLQQQLASEAEMHPIAVAKIVTALEREAAAAASVDAEVHAIAAEADRQEISRALTLDYLLPGPLAAAVEARTRYMPVAGPSAVLMLLCAFAAAARLGTQVVGSAASGFVVPANLYGCGVGPSGVMKSPAAKAVIREPLEPLVGNIRQEYEQRMENWRQQCRDTPRGEPKPEPPQPSHLIASDPTGEALVAALQQNEAEGLGLLLYRDELAGLFGGLNQYRGGRGSDRELLLELFDGGGMGQLRVVGGGRFFSRSQFSIYGTTQPEVLRGLVAEGDPSGLWARFVFAPIPPVAVRLPDDDDDAATRAAADTMQRVAHAVHQLTPRPYRLDSAGAARFRDYHYQRQQAALAATLPAHSALYGKAAGKVLRVAGLLHLAGIGAGTAADTGPIPDGTVERAVILVDHLDGYALGIHADAAGSGPSGVMRTVHRIAEDAGEPITPNQVRKKLSPRQRQEWDPATIAAAMKALAGASYGELSEGAKGAARYRAIRGLP